MPEGVRTFLIVGMLAVAVAIGFAWYDSRNEPSSDVKVGECIDSKYHRVDCGSPHAVFVVLGDANGADPQDACRAYPDNASVIGFTNGAGGLRQICVARK